MIRTVPTVQRNVDETETISVFKNEFAQPNGRGTAYENYHSY